MRIEHECSGETFHASRCNNAADVTCRSAKCTRKGSRNQQEHTLLDPRVIDQGESYGCPQEVFYTQDVIR